MVFCRMEVILESWFSWIMGWMGSRCLYVMFRLVNIDLILVGYLRYSWGMDRMLSVTFMTAADTNSSIPEYSVILRKGECPPINCRKFMAKPKVLSAFVSDMGKGEFGESLSLTRRGRFSIRDNILDIKWSSVSGLRVLS